jgi:hypothetical protein
MIRKSWPFWLGGLFIAWAFDFLFWQKAPGISILIWVGLVLIAGGFLLFSEHVRPAWQNLLLMVGALGMAVIMVLRLEPFTRFVAFCIMFGLLFLLTFSYQKAYWIGYRTRDYFTAFFQMIGGMFSRGLGLIASRKANRGLQQTEDEKKSVQRSTGKLIGSILLGIGIAIPILTVLIALLASADLAFASQLNKIIQALNLQNLPEWIFRIVYIVILADLIVGLWLHAGFLKKPENPETGRTPTKPFLGWIPTIIPLVSIVILFAVFVIVQFRYLFGAQSNITFEGFTYAEYARRGIFELLVTAIITLALDLIFSAISSRKGKIQEGVFTSLRVAMLALVLVILASAIQRLTLYENAYGFSRIRTYSHIFIFWLGGLIAATIILVLIKKSKFFGLAVIFAVVGYGATLAGVNVDGFIAKQNIQRATMGYELDSVYLGMLSNDAVSVMVSEFSSVTLPQNVKDVIGSDLACRLKLAQESNKLPWQSFHISTATAFTRLSSISSELAKYPVTQKNGNDEVIIGSSEFPCYFVSGMD